MKNSYDIVVVGASSAGAYYARRMAEQGFSVLVIDKMSKETISPEYDIAHFDRRDMVKHGLPIPQEGDGIWSFAFDKAYHYSPTYTDPKPYDVETIGIHKRAYIQKLNEWAEEAGAEFLYEAPFQSVQTKGSAVTGVTFQHGGKDVSVTARLVVDASGQGAVVRTALPKKIGVETFKLTNRDVFFVRLRYIQFEERKRWMTNHSWLSYKMWLAPSDDAYDGILGIGSCLSYDQGDEYYNLFLKNVAPKLPPYKVAKIEEKPTPYHRSLFNYVGTGFLAIGDAAIVNRADNGEGMAEAMNHIDIAIEVTAKALKKAGKPTKKDLWRINKKYNNGQGRDTALLLAVMAKVLVCSQETIQYMFERDCIMAKCIIADLGVGITGKDILHQIKEIIRGLRNGRLPKDQMKVVGAGVAKALPLAVLYTLYPPTPFGYKTWTKLTQKVWDSVGQMSDLYA